MRIVLSIVVVMSAELCAGCFTSSCSDEMPASQTGMHPSASSHEAASPTPEPTPAPSHASASSYEAASPTPEPTPAPSHASASSYEAASPTPEPTPAPSHASASSHEAASHAEATATMTPTSSVDCHIDSRTTLSTLGAFPIGVTCIHYPELKLVKGDLVVGPIATLEIALFPRLESVGGKFKFTSCPALVKIIAPRLAHVTGRVHVLMNPLLETLNLNSLATVGDYFNVNSNPLLTSLGAAALGKLVSVGGYFYLGQSAIPGQLDLSNVTSFIGVEITSNTALVSVNMPLGTSVGGKFLVKNNTLLEWCDFSTMVTSVEVSIQQNAVLKTVSLGNLTATSGLVYVWSNPLLETVDLNRLATVDGYFNVNSNPSLNSLGAAALGNLVSVGGYFYVGQSSIPLLSLSQLGSVGGFHFQIKGNSALVSLAVPILPSLHGYLQVDSNSLLQTISMPFLVSIGTKLLVTSNNALETILLPHLETVATTVEVTKNPALLTLNVCSLISHGGITLTGYGSSFVCGALKPLLHPSCGHEGCSLTATASGTSEASQTRTSTPGAPGSASSHEASGQGQQRTSTMLSETPSMSLTLSRFSPSASVTPTKTVTRTGKSNSANTWSTSYPTTTRTGTHSGSHSLTGSPTLTPPPTKTFLGTPSSTFATSTQTATSSPSRSLFTQTASITPAPTESHEQTATATHHNTITLSMPVIIPDTQFTAEVAATKTSVSVIAGTATAASFLGSSGSAVDAQSLAVIGLIPCAGVGEREAMKNDRLLSPLATSNTHEGMIYGNWILIAATSGLHRLLAMVVYQVKKKKGSFTWDEARAMTKYPSWSLLPVFLQYQGTAAASLMLVTDSSSPAGSIVLGVIGLIFTIATPLGLCGLAYWNISATFNHFDYGDSKLKSLPAAFRGTLLPKGRWLPLVMRQQYGSLFSRLGRYEKIWMTSCFWSPTLMLTGLLFHPETPSGCAALFGSLCAGEFILTAITLVFRPLRSFLSNFLGAISTLCLALILLGLSIQAENPTFLPARTLVLRGVQAQLGITALRLLWGVTTFLMETLWLTKVVPLVPDVPNGVWISYREKREVARAEEHSSDGSDELNERLLGAEDGDTTANGRSESRNDPTQRQNVTTTAYVSVLGNSSNNNATATSPTQHSGDNSIEDSAFFSPVASPLLRLPGRSFGSNSRLGNADTNASSFLGRSFVGEGPSFAVGNGMSDSTRTAAARPVPAESSSASDKTFAAGAARKSRRPGAGAFSDIWIDPKLVRQAEEEANLSHGQRTTGSLLTTQHGVEGKDDFGSPFLLQRRAEPHNIRSGAQATAADWGVPARSLGDVGRYMSSLDGDALRQEMDELESSIRSPLVTKRSANLKAKTTGVPLSLDLSSSIMSPLGTRRGANLGATTAADWGVPAGSLGDAGRYMSSLDGDALRREMDELESSIRSPLVTKRSANLRAKPTGVPLSLDLSSSIQPWSPLGTKRGANFGAKTTAAERGVPAGSLSLSSSVMSPLVAKHKPAGSLGDVERKWPVDDDLESYL